MEPEQNNGGSKGSLVGTIIVVIILIIGAIYLLSGRTAPQEPLPNGESTGTSTDEMGTTTLGEDTGSVTSVNDLEQAAGSIKVDNLDAVASDLDNALGQ